jgi:hypothetical protein
MKTTKDLCEDPPPEKSPYEGNWFSRLFFIYMADAMSLANKRLKEGSSLKGKFNESNGE